jgi:O-antigen/teichoic acid export membrane protein
MTLAAISLRRFGRPVRHALRNDFLRHGALVFAATMLGNVLNYVFNFAVSRRLGVENYAELSSIVSGLMVFALPGTIVNLVVVKYVGELHDSSRLWSFARALLKWTGIAAVGFFAVGMLLRAFISSFLHIPNDATIVFAITIVAAGLLTPGIRGILQGEQDFLRFSISVLLEVLGKAALGIALVYAGFGVGGAVFGWLCGTAVALLYAVWAVRLRKTATAVASMPVKWRRIIQTTAGVAAATALLTVMSFMDVILVKHFFNEHQAGLYAAVNLTGKVILFVVSFLPMILLPKAVAIAKKGDSPMQLLLQAGGVTIGMCAVAVFAFGSMPALVVRLLAGRAFIGAAPYVLQYDIAMAMLALVTLVVNYKIALHRFDFIYALLAILMAEGAGLALFHTSLWDVVHVLLIGNACALVACLYRVGAPAKITDPAVYSEAAIC